MPRLTGNFYENWEGLNVFDVKEYRKQVSRMASIANKRIKRLQDRNLTDSPAYQALFDKDDNPKFSVRGKTHNEVQQEASKLRRFLMAQTSTIRGIEQNLKEIADNTGIAYDNLADLKKKSAKFFELVSKTQQYLRSTQDAASAIGYQKLWEAINTYVQDENIDLADADVTVESLIEKVDVILSKAPKHHIELMDGFDGEAYLE